MRWIVLLLLVLAAPASATEARYEGYAAGVNVVDVDARFEVGPERYRVALDYRTVGALGWVARGRQQASASGRFVGGRPAPARMASAGTVRGERRVVEIDYASGQPEVRQLVPSGEGEREAVPGPERAGTIDPLSGMAELIRQVNATGRCDGRVTMFDGRRLGVLEVRTGGVQVLEPTRRSSFAGRALRCDFVGRQTGGFMLDADRAQARRPQEGTAWFAAAAADGPMIPVRVAFRTRWLGDATMYLVGGG